MDRTISAFLHFRAVAREKFEKQEEESEKRDETGGKALMRGQRTPGEDDHANRAAAQGARPSSSLLSTLNTINNIHNYIHN